MFRLGREYLQVGQLTEFYLPTKGVRFIAINDGRTRWWRAALTSILSENWANELHAKDTSKKVRAVQKMQAERDGRLGGRPPFGYRRKTPDIKELRREMYVLRKELDVMRKRDNELSVLFKRLYEDHVLQRITAEQFRMLPNDYNTGQKGLQEAIPEKEARLERLKASATNVEAFIEKAKRFTTIDQLTPELVRLFIQHIEIGETAPERFPFCPRHQNRLPGHRVYEQPDVPGECPPQHLLPPIPPIEEFMKMLA